VLKKISYYIAPLFLKILLFCIFNTCKWRVYNDSYFKQAQQIKFPILICSWHNCFLLVARYFKNTKTSVWAISSTHKDSEIMASILKTWNFQLIKGSSTRGWRNVIKNMMTLFNNPNNIVAVTNDGPKGPPFTAKPGSINLALKKQAQIIAVSATANRFWRLPSWDQTIIPKPFSTISIQFAPSFINKNYSEKEASVAVSKYMTYNTVDLNSKINKK
tara:strand:- start:10764 stop:11414 length:651 start_codon:yes stop_codon:yes gene_type:complete